MFIFYEPRINQWSQSHDYEEMKKSLAKRPLLRGGLFDHVTAEFLIYDAS